MQWAKLIELSNVDIFKKFYFLIRKKKKPSREGIMKIKRENIPGALYVYAAFCPLFLNKMLMKADLQSEIRNLCRRFCQLGDISATELTFIG